MEIKINLINTIFILICIILSYKMLQKRESTGGNFSPDTSQSMNFFYGLILVLFILIYGGIFYW